MMMMKLLSIVVSLCAVFTTTAASSLRNLQDAAERTLAEIIAGEEDLTTIAAAIDAAGFVPGDICSTGNCTVFAPTDDGGFGEVCIDQEFLAKLLTPEYVLHLQTVLLMHISEPTIDRILSTEIMDGMEFNMESGEITQAVFEASSGQVPIEYLVIRTPDTEGDVDSIVIDADYIASNGNLHKVTCILLPSFTDYTLQELGTVEPGFSILNELIESTGIGGAIPGDFTILAPTDDAFLALGNETLEALKEDSAALISILSNHVVADEVLPSVLLANGQTITTFGGLEVVVNLDADSVMFNDATVVRPDILASNGIAHGIDRVLGVDIPTGPPAPAPAPAPSPVPGKLLVESLVSSRQLMA